MILKVCRESSYPPDCNSDDPALKWGNTISDVLIPTRVVAEERGRVEIDSSYTNRKSIGIVIPVIKYMQPGSIVQIVEEAESHIGVLRKVALSVRRSDNSISINTTAEIERNV